MEVQNCETLSNKVKIMCENILKFIATPELKEVCENTVSKIFEILKKVNFTMRGIRKILHWYPPDALKQLLLAFIHYWKCSSDKAWNCFSFYVYSNLRTHATSDQRKLMMIIGRTTHTSSVKHFFVHLSSSISFSRLEKNTVVLSNFCSYKILGISSHPYL